ncbi:MAG TPA: N-acyl homoserine lactonase family protein [Baekduia sp.]|nr:N-acyl homoserine lactonase family protein [Baekduia sp.]
MTARMKAMPDFYARPRGPKPLATVKGMGLHIPRSRWFWLPIPAFCVEHPTAGPILIDTGLSAQVATDAGAALGRLGRLAFTIDMKPAWAAPAQLRRRGIDPAAVELIVMTHLHYDHASGLAQFPGAKVVVDEREREAARKGSMLDGYIERLHATPGQRWETLPHDEQEIDLLGDGTLRLVSTPGHSAGHRSVILRLRGDRELLLTGDAAYARQTVEEQLLPLLTWDDDAYRRSLSWVREWVAAHPGAPYIPGHDAAAWSDLDAVYE